MVSRSKRPSSSPTCRTSSWCHEDEALDTSPVDCTSPSALDVQGLNDHLILSSTRSYSPSSPSSSSSSSSSPSSSLSNRDEEDESGSGNEEMSFSSLNRMSLQGSSRFLLLQLFGWLLYSFSLSLALYFVYSGMKEMAFSIMTTIGVSGLIAQLLVLISLHYYVSSTSTCPVPVSSAQQKRRVEPNVWAALTTKSGFAGVSITLLSILLALLLESDPAASTSKSLTSHYSLRSLLTSSLLLGVPFTHILTGKQISPVYSLFQPFQGGPLFVILQAIGWTCWFCAVCSSLFGLFFFWHIPLVITGTGLVGTCSQFFILISLRYFDAQFTTAFQRHRQNKQLSNAFASSRSLLDLPVVSEEEEKEVEEEKETVENETEPAKQKDRRPKIKRLSSISYNSNRSTDITHLDTLSLNSAYHEKRHSQALHELQCELAKKRRYTSSARRLYDYCRMELNSQGIKPYVLKGEVDASSSWTSLKSFDWTEWRTYMQSTIIIILMYFVPIFGALLAVSPIFLYYTIAHRTTFIVPLILCCAGYYATTFRGRPGLTGKRSWDWFRKSSWLWSSFEHYFSASLIAEGHLDETKGPFIFAFHPHGCYPLTCFWSTRGPLFRTAYPALEIDVCGASIMFVCPILREILLWSGGREVSAASIRHALRSRRSVLLVPGGQREMLHSKADHRALTIVTRHKGFVRMALETGTRIVPILSLGETFILQNINLPSLQSWFLKHTGVGWPVFPYGRWYSPIGIPHPITIIVGEPIECQKIEQPTQGDIDKLHARYYDAVRQLFEKYKSEAGFPDQMLLFSDH